MGFSLIEIIGVLAVLAIGAVAVLSLTTKSIDVNFSKQESANLQGFASALQTSILRNRYIPGTNDWYQIVAAEMGVSTNNVLYNLRNPSSQRAFLVDPNLSIGGGTLPYTQDRTNGSPQPSNSRVMILSSIAPSAPLPPAGVVSSNFNTLWNTADGALPASGFAGWGGTGDDLKIQRINLGPLFINLSLADYSTTNLGQYRIDGAGPCNVPLATGVSGYFLQTTLLDLLTDSAAGGTTNARLILDNTASYFYVAGVWRNVPYVPAATGTALGQTNGDAATLAQMISISAGLFGSSPYNSAAAAGVTPPIVVNAMSNFMYNYIPYANWVVNSNGGTWATSGPYYSAASASQSALYNAMNNLLNYPPGPSQGGCTIP
jgi:type II secretory pathway pseudopilin PulG